MKKVISNTMLERIKEEIAINWVLWREAFNVMVKSPWACVVYNTKGCVPYYLSVVGEFNLILIGVNDESNQKEAREILGNEHMDPEGENISTRISLYIKALGMVEEGLLDEDFVEDLFFGDLSEFLEEEYPEEFLEDLFFGDLSEFDEEEYLIEE